MIGGGIVGDGGIGGGTNGNGNEGSREHLKCPGGSGKLQMPGGGPSHCAGGRDNLSSGAVDGLATVMVGLANVMDGALDGEGVGKVGVMTGTELA
jgi:hypothetical protein